MRAETISIEKLVVSLIVAGALALVSGRPAGAQEAGGGAVLKENLDLPYDARGEEEEEEEAPEIVVFYGQQLEGDGFFYAVDRSGSMQDSGELGVAKRELGRNVMEFSDNVQFGIVFFDVNVIKFPANGQPSEASPAMKSAATSWIQSVPGGSGSCCQQGLIAALQMANRATSGRRVLVYLGDGGGTCQGADEATYLNTTLSVVTASNYNRVQINTIGVLNVGSIQENFLRRLAAANGGTYKRINR
ncbi:MAG: vWA domain-containing protein [Planctomycetota bacterium]